MSRYPGQMQGEMSEMEVALDLIKNECRVSQTFGHSHPYDLIADTGSHLIKLQVKTASPRKGANQVVIEPRDSQDYSAENIDLYVGYSPDEDGVFYVPYNEMGKRASVTFTPLDEMGPTVNQEKANHISDYTFEKAYQRWKEYRGKTEED